jgi:hypothetical protein
MNTAFGTIFSNALLKANRLIEAFTDGWHQFVASHFL